ALLPDASVDCLYILFPTPPSSPKRALLTPMFADSVERVLRPGGCLWFATDVSGLADAVDELFRWPPSPAPLLGSQLSRRERICRRDELPIFRRCLARPASFAR
ncbi:MAG: hypothetical protein EXR71_18025, partial [Myxococcales bacterium]|nr:hypothetical protein [Myxococcales bacterium]